MRNTLEQPVFRATRSNNDSVPNFVDHSWLFYNSPSLRSSVFRRYVSVVRPTLSSKYLTLSFRRPGLHINCFAYMLLGLTTFFTTKVAIDTDSFDGSHELGKFYGTSSTSQVGYRTCLTFGADST